MTGTASPRPAAPGRPPVPPPDRSPQRGGLTAGIGELLATVGVVLLLFVGYQLWVTDLVTAQAQNRVTGELDRLWAGHSAAADGPLQLPAEGAGLAKLYLPTLDASFTVVQGVTQDDLAVGPGHYPDSALPGAQGNLAIAGHRVSHGAPFTDLDALRSCDPLVLETQDSWFVYRVLPFAEEVPGWADGRGADPNCREVSPPDGPYQGLVGQEIVPPARGDVVAPVPGSPGMRAPADESMALITLTTCHPKFSARERLIVHGVLVAGYAKDPDRPLRPAELDTH